jgi:hypothetical protein
VPRLRDRGDLLVGQLCERPDVARRVDDDLLALEGGIEVRDDSDEPARVAADAKRLGWRSLLAPRAERAAGELRPVGLVREARLRARSPAPVRRDDDEPPGERISPEIQSPWCRPARGTC